VKRTGKILKRLLTIYYIKEVKETKEARDYFLRLTKDKYFNRYGRIFGSKAIKWLLLP